ncbi:hypothetical protein EON62_00645, partial [archaeon]
MRAHAYGSCDLLLLLPPSPVAVASRMMSHGEVNRIHMSTSTVNVLKRHSECDTLFDIVERGYISVRNRGDILTSWLQPGPGLLPVCRSAFGERVVAVLTNRQDDVSPALPQVTSRHGDDGAQPPAVSPNALDSEAAAAYEVDQELPPACTVGEGLTQESSPFDGAATVGVSPTGATLELVPANELLAASVLEQMQQHRVREPGRGGSPSFPRATSSAASPRAHMMKLPSHGGSSSEPSAAAAAAAPQLASPKAAGAGSARRAHFPRSGSGMYERTMSPIVSGAGATSSGLASPALHHAGMRSPDLEAVGIPMSSRKQDTSPQVTHGAKVLSSMAGMGTGETPTGHNVPDSSARYTSPEADPLSLNQMVRTFSTRILGLNLRSMMGGGQHSARHSSSAAAGVGTVSEGPPMSSAARSYGFEATGSVSQFQTEDLTY